MADAPKGGGMPKPAPMPSDVTQFYWDAAKDHRLVIQRCDDCMRYIHPPLALCCNCQSSSLAPAEVSGKGSIYTFTVINRMFHPGWAEEIPYVVALIDLVEQDDVRLVANIVDSDIDGLEIGMPVEVTFEDRGDHSVPQFRVTGS